MHWKGSNARSAIVRRRAFGGDDSMKVQCESCNANGQVSEEASLRAVLWVCDGCDVRYLVSSRGMRRAPLPPPPPPKRERPTIDHALPPPLFVDSRERAPASSSEPAAEPPAPKVAEPSSRADRSLPMIPLAKAVEGTPPETLPLFNTSVPSFPVMTVPVHDPLWRRPALLASALAGLLVGLAAYGVQWTRDQVQNYEPAVATAAASPQETLSPALLLADESEAEITLEDREHAPALPKAKEAAREETRAERPLTTAPKASRRAHPPRANARASTAPKSKKEEPLTVAAVAQPAPVEGISSPAPKESEPAGFADALAKAVEPRAGSEPQAKSRPTSSDNAAKLDGYTPFSRDAALSALSAAASSASHCRSNEGPFGAARVAVTFAPSGEATAAIIEGPPFAGTPVGSCIARAFREARVSPFSGAPVTVRKSMSIF